MKCWPILNSDLKWLYWIERSFEVNMRSNKKKLITLIGKFLGYELDRFMEYSSNQNLWVPIQFCSNSRHELYQSLENSSNSQFYNFLAGHEPNMDELSRIRSSSCPDIVQKLNKYSQKIDEWIFQKSVRLISWKLKFRKNTGWVFQDLPILG